MPPLSGRPTRRYEAKEASKPKTAEEKAAAKARKKKEMQERIAEKRRQKKAKEGL